MTINAPEVARILGGERTLHRQVRTVDDLREAVEGGLTVEALERTVRRVFGEGCAVTELKHCIVLKTTL